MKDYKNTIFNIIGKLDNGSHSSSQLQAVDEELQELVDQVISERDKEWYKNLELATTAVSEDGKVRFVRIDEPDFTSRLQTLIK